MFLVVMISVLCISEFLRGLIIMLGVFFFFLAVFLFVIIFFFFFSSRRRHTRLQGDWSSDVCSSDLRDPAQLMGRTDGFKTVILPAGVGAVGELVDVTIERATMATLFGR